MTDKPETPLPCCYSCDCVFNLWNGRVGGLAVPCSCSKDTLLRGLRLLAAREALLGALRCSIITCTRPAGHSGAHGPRCTHRSCDQIAGHEGPHGP